MNKAQIKSSLTSKIKEILQEIKECKPDELVALRKGHVIPSNEKGQDLLLSPIKFVLTNREISEKYSDEFIVREFFTLYRKLLFESGSKGTIAIDDSNINTHMENLISKLLDSQEETFHFVSEVYNLEMGDDQEYRFIDSTIKILKQEDLSHIDKKLQEHGRDLIGKPAILTKVQAGEGDFAKAKERAFYNFKLSLYLLRLYFPYAKPVLKGCLTNEDQLFIGYGKRSKICYRDTVPEGNSRSYPAFLDSEKYGDLVNEGITALEKDCSISKVAKDSLYWFGLGLDEEYLSAKLVDFTLVLESVLKKKDEQTELRRAIVERGAILLFNTFEDRKNAAKELKDIYDVRSKVVHTGTTIVNENIVSTAEEYARKVTKKLITKSEEFNGDFDKFIDYLDDTKLRGPSNV